MMNARKIYDWLGLSAWVVLVACVTAGCRSSAMHGEASVQDDSAARAKTKWELRIQGNQSLGDGALRDVVIDYMADFEKSGFAHSVIDDAAYAIESHYKSKGWPFASATYSVTERRPGDLLAEIRVAEGERCALGRVSFEGVEVFAHGELRKRFDRPEEGLFKGRTWFVQSDADAAVSELTSLYLAAGYLLVQVELPVVSYRDDNKIADLLYRVREGVLFEVEEIEYDGETKLPEDELESVVAVTPGAPYSPKLDRRIQSSLVEALGAAGYPDATVRVIRHADEETGKVALKIRVRAGQHIVVRDIRVEGNERTSAALIRSRLDVEFGQPFTPDRERKSFRQLFTTGLFSAIALDLEGDELATEKTLVVRVSESPAREIFFEPGWGSYELARIKAGYRNKNIFGTGRGFRAEGIASIKHNEFEVGINDPYLFGADVFADLSATVLRRIEPSFTRSSAGIDATVARRWEAGYETGLAYQFRRSTAEDVDITDPAALAALDNLSISALEISLRYDTRDNPLVPTRGQTARFALQWGDQILGSELDFLRARVQLTKFYALNTRNTLGFAVRTGSIIPTHNSDEIPLQERFFNGGEGTVRSFRENELGPLDATGEALGGEAFSVISAELRHQLKGNLSGALFVDTGNVTPNYEDYFDFDDFRTAIGIGIRYMLPIGPLRVDGGWNPNPRTGEDNFVLHFSVGMPF